MHQEDMCGNEYMMKENMWRWCDNWADRQTTDRPGRPLGGQADHWADRQTTVTRQHSYKNK